MFFAASAARSARVDEKKSSKALACAAVIVAYTRLNSTMSRDSMARAYASITAAMSALGFEGAAAAVGAVAAGRGCGAAVCVSLTAVGTCVTGGRGEMAGEFTTAGGADLS